LVAKRALQGVDVVCPTALCPNRILSDGILSESHFVRIYFVWPNFVRPHFVRPHFVRPHFVRILVSFQGNSVQWVVGLSWVRTKDQGSQTAKKSSTFVTVMKPISLRSQRKDGGKFSKAKFSMKLFVAMKCYTWSSLKLEPKAGNRRRLWVQRRCTTTGGMIYFCVLRDCHYYVIL
jgi:hypothetical protein